MKTHGEQLGPAVAQGGPNIKGFTSTLSKRLQFFMTSLCSGGTAGHFFKYDVMATPNRKRLSSRCRRTVVGHQHYNISCLYIRLYCICLCVFILSFFVCVLKVKGLPHTYKKTDTPPTPKWTSFFTRRLQKKIRWHNF